MHQRLLTTPRFFVEQRVCPGPDGQPINRYMVVHPGAVVILPLIEPASVVMIHQMRWGVDEQLWELPAGTLESNEEPLSAAQRELEEETGFQAEVVSPLNRFYASPGISTEIMHTFIATELKEVGQHLDAGEQIRVETMSLDRVKKMILNGEIIDGKTLAVFGYYFLKTGA